jgi:hypothetical protein
LNPPNLPLGTPLAHTIRLGKDRDITRLTVAFRNFLNAPKKGSMMEERMERNTVKGGYSVWTRDHVATVVMNSYVFRAGFVSFHCKENSKGTTFQAADALKLRPLFFGGVTKRWVESWLPIFNGHAVQGPQVSVWV